jgi:hypothetical protein
MKKLVEIPEEGLEGLLGKHITLICTRYIYSGVLEGVNDFCILLKDAEIVYETGAWSAKQWSGAEKVPSPFYVTRQSIESFLEK